MHDSVTGELLGIPSVSIMTEKFVSAAQLMGRVLGAEGYPFIVVGHPFSSASDTELNERARVAADACAEHLVLS